MKIRKTLAFIICVAMIFTATQTTITYADDSTTPTVYVESVSATQGSRVTVYVGIRNAVDLGGLDVSVFYDSKAFTLVSADKGNFVAGASVSINTKNAGTVRESIVALDGMNGDGYLMSVCFDISENAAVKDYDITVGIGEAFDTSVPPNSVTVERTSGIITVERNEIIQRYANFYSFAEPSNSVSEGDEVHFKVFGGDVNGLASGIFEFTYDPEILEYVGYELGDELLSNTAIHSVNSRTPGLVRIVYAEIEAITEDYGQLFFDMTFRVRKNTSENTTVSFAGSSLLDENLNSMTTNGTRREISVIKKRSSLLVNWDGTQDGDRKFTVDVILTGDSNVSAGDFAVIYDTSTVSCEAVTVDGSVAADGALLVYNENISDGRVSFSYVNSNGCSKDSTVLNITYRQPNCIAGGTYFLPTGRDVVDKDLNDLELIYNFYNITMPYDMGHILVPTAAVEPTCTEDGNSAYWTCTNCGKFFSDAEGKNQIEENGWIEKALDHDYIYHSAKDPTCTEAGWYSYYTCSRCEYTTYQEIDAIGHDWGTPKYDWADDYSSVSAERVCMNDPTHVERETVNTTSEVTKTATCEENGETTYTATFTNDAFAGQTKTVDNIPATGHDWKFIDLVWTGDDENGYTAATAHYECLNDEAHNRSVSAVITKETSDATCTKPGTVTYTASVSKEAAPDGKAITDTKVVSGVPLGHDYEAANWDWSEDMSTASVTLVCKNDNSHMETVTATVTKVRTEPTCEKAGSIVYTAKVEFDGKEYTNSVKEDLAAIGHDWGAPSYTWAPDSSEVTARRICANDPTHIEEETVSTEAKVTKAATCETKGETTYTAFFTNEGFETQSKTIANIDAIGHDWGTPKYDWSDDYSSVYAERVCANDPSHIESETAYTTSCNYRIS